ncbi:ribosome-associated protein [Neomicrococcus lactis]|uniref:Ribosome-associated protein n=1 Tax=Neomicrococcus lactis TaxID=732241 RepID=A0A7W9DA15_9MICC|nr:ribosome-associated protein [Neomicrococcus lactis]
MSSSTLPVTVGHNGLVKDLYVPPAPGAPEGLRIPSGELVEQFSRSSGPGGQGVNTADTRVQLSFDLASTTALNESQRSQIIAQLAERISGTVITIRASEHRSQRFNRTAARERLIAMLREAVAPPIIRRPSKPTQGSRRRRLQAKRLRSETKRNRQRPASD